MLNFNSKTEDNISYLIILLYYWEKFPLQDDSYGNLWTNLHARTHLISLQQMQHCKA